MNQSKFSNLNKYLKCQHFELLKDSEIYNIFKKDCETRIDECKYGVGIIETQTNNIFVLEVSNEIENYESVEYYLQQLPNLDLKTVTMFLCMTGANSILVENLFRMPDNFPSPFAASFLKETYGNIFFDYQFIQLLQCSLPNEEKGLKQIVEYKRQFNCGMARFTDKLKELYLPDGYNLYDLFEKYTPGGRRNNTENKFGFAVHPSYISAYQFINYLKNILQNESC